MGFLDKLLNGMSNYANEVEAVYEEEKKYMKYETDAKLKEIASHGTSARAMGRRKAALEELRRRGYNV